MAEMADMADVAGKARPRRYWLLAAVVTLLAAGLRLYGLTETSLTVDEGTLFIFAKSIHTYGYPVIWGGTVEAQLATYEFYSYILALSLAIFGDSDFAMRFPNFLMAVGTAYLIYSAGCRWFNLRTGFIAGLLFACAPWAIFWGQNGFHPQAHQFFGLLTLIQAVRILKDEPVAPRTYYLAALFFCLGYLSWEGLGFILPELVIAALIMTWGRWKWLISGHLWTACAIVIGVILAQGVRRTLLLDNYLLVGTGRSEIAGPELAFLQPFYEPYFYVNQIFGWYTQFVVAIVFFLGVFFAPRNWHFRFLATFTLTSVLLLANLLSYYTLHYVYAVLPAFVLSVAATTVIFVDWLAQRDTQLSPRRRDWAGAIALSALTGLELATAGVLGLKTYSITPTAQSPSGTAYGTRRGTEFVDYRGNAKDYNAIAVPGDPAVVQTALAFGKYTENRDKHMFMESWTYQKVLFDPGGDRVHFISKASSGIVVKDLRMLEDVLGRNQRLWFVVAPYDVSVSALDPEMLLTFQRFTKLKSESYQAKVLLWTQ